jgi:imidazolonepropionase-like amidohydrolase
MLLLKNARMADGAGLKFERADLLIRDGRIAAISAAPLDAPGAATHDLAGLTLVPGLMNAHAHICLDGGGDPEATLRAETPAETAIRAMRRLEETIRMGVTTIRDVGGPAGIDIALMRMQERGEIVGPRMFASGRVVTMTGGHGWMTGREVDGPAEARKAAREQLKAGARHIKVMATGGMMTPGQRAGAPQLTTEEMAAAIEEAHKAGFKTGAHVESAEGARNAVLAGVDSVEHGHGMDQSVVDLMVERGTALVPTILSDVAINEGGVERGIPAFVVEKCRPMFESLLVAFELARRAGVRIAAGNDGGAPFVHCGDIAGELELYVRYGMTPQEALRTATLNTAQLFGLSDAGRLESGCVADLVAVAGDPLAQIAALRQVRWVIQAGKIIVRPDRTCEV